MAYQPKASSDGDDFCDLRSPSTASIQGGMCGAEGKESAKSAPSGEAPYHTLLALDFDQTLAMTYPHIVPVWDAYMAEWLVQHGHYASLDEARANIPAIANPYGCGPTAMAKQFGENKAWIEAFYLTSAPLLVQACTQGQMSVSPQLKPTLLQLQSQGYWPLIISQGHRDSVLPLLQLIGLEDVFKPTQVIDRAHKRLEPHGYQLAKYLARAYPITRYIIADDSPDNFTHAKAEGFETALIEPNPTPAALSAADTHAPDVLSFLKTLL